MRDQARELKRSADALWAESCARYPGSELERLEVFFAVARGEATPPDPGPQRALHSRLYVPGLTERPWWDAHAFPLARRLESRFPLIREEAVRLLSKPWVFRSHPGRSGSSPAKDPQSPLEGEWRGYYLQRHLRRVPSTAAEAPVALRTLDEVPPAREALMSFLGPHSRIKEHSDKVNFVVTLYLPLFSDGAWISFGGQRRTWIDGRCMAADSSYYHESVNTSDVWRGLMLVDLWHPELSEIERTVLERAVPRLNDVLLWGAPN
ncbi:MAG: aspartyl/asparaginyl beta-hydroxylase domain-containing protein [Myxococcales bacterium]|nr:aspartyl/asparaginyl beta-hydroxylase domain-containing protein [Myxococcales bacterium]